MAFTFELTLDIALGALFIFGLRIFGIAISTVRMLIMVRGQRLLSAFVGFFESLVFVIALGGVFSELDNIWNTIAYSSGFAVGTYVGMVWEQRLITNAYVSVNIVSAEKAHEIAEAVRKVGFGVTESLAQGSRGLVGTLFVVARRKDVQLIVKLVSSIDDGAFITLEELRAVVRHGYIAGRPLR